MKKIVNFIIASAILFTGSVSTTIASEKSGSSDNLEFTYFEDGYIQEVETDNINTKEWLIYDTGKWHTLYIDYNQQIMVMDGETIRYTYEEISVPSSRTTIDYATARKFNAKVPWKGSSVLLAAGIAALVPGTAAYIIPLIVNALTADAENVWLTFTQYDSKETYWSSYESIYYKKSINRDIIFYENSVSPANKIYGTYQGSWFDPVRPY